METKIKWHKTSEEMPEQKIVMLKNKKGLYEYKIDEPCLVIWENRVKPSRYLTEQKRWEGHTETEVPEYWVKLSELKTEEKDD